MILIPDSKCNIRRSVPSDIPVFRKFWGLVVEWRKTRGLPPWPVFPGTQIEKEIHSGLHFSILSHADVLAGYFSIALCDELLPGDGERSDAIHIHRICVGPEHKGNDNDPNGSNEAAMKIQLLVRKLHRHACIAFALTILTYLLFLIGGTPPSLVIYAPLAPLAFLFFTGLYLFALPYFNKNTRH